MTRYALKSSKKTALTLIAAAAFSLTMVAPTMAADDTTAVVTAGTLTITNPLVSDFEGRNVTGSAQTTNADLDAFSVSDLRGTGEGWHVTAQATQFDGAISTNALAAGSLSMSQPTVASPNTTSPDPSIVAGPYVIDDGAVQFSSAAVGNGMGVYDYSATELTLALPADVHADAYTSIVTISIVSAP